MPINTGRFGAANTAAEVFGASEITPLQLRFERFDEWVGEDIPRFTSYPVGT